MVSSFLAFSFLLVLPNAPQFWEPRQERVYSLPSSVYLCACSLLVTFLGAVLKKLFCTRSGLYRITCSSSSPSRVISCRLPLFPRSSSLGVPRTLHLPFPQSPSWRGSRCRLPFVIFQTDRFSLDVSEVDQFFNSSFH